MTRSPMPQKVFLPSSLLEDSRAEPLSVRLPYYKGITEVPGDVGHGDEVTLVFIELQKVFKKAGNVSEGLMGNIIWGFEQCGYDPRAVAKGLSGLRTLGYTKYTDPVGEELHELSFDPKTPIWIRYTNKMMDLFVKE